MTFKYFFLDIPIWDSRIHFLPYQGKKMRSRLMRLGLSEEEVEDAIEGNYGGQTFCTESLDSVIIINKQKNTPELLGILSHEIFHAVHDILETRGQDFYKDEANESYAYLLGYVMCKASEKILKKKS